MSTIVRGTILLDPTTAAVAVASLAPLIPDGKAWKHVRSVFAINIGGPTSTAGTTQNHMNGVVSNKELLISLTGDLLTNESALVVGNLGETETDVGWVDHYKAGFVDGMSMIDDVYLSPEFFVSLVSNAITVTANDQAWLSYLIELDEVKLTTKIQQAILDSM